MYIVTKEIEFCAAHRLPSTFHGNCRNLHGHNYRVIVSFAGVRSDFDKNGILVDFGEIKSKCKGWIDENLDHAYISADGARVHEGEPFVAEHGFTKIYQMPTGMTSSAECLSRHLCDVFIDLFKPDPELGLVVGGAKIHSVTVWETPTSYATCTR